jgi:hypothetical protein
VSEKSNVGIFRDLSLVNDLAVDNLSGSNSHDVDILATPNIPPSHPSKIRCVP